MIPGFTKTFTTFTNYFSVTIFFLSTIFIVKDWNVLNSLCKLCVTHIHTYIFLMCASKFYSPIYGAHLSAHLDIKARLFVWWGCWALTNILSRIQRYFDINVVLYLYKTLCKMWKKKILCPPSQLSRFIINKMDNKTNETFYSAKLSILCSWILFEEKENIQTVNFVCVSIKTIIYYTI